MAKAPKRTRNRTKDEWVAIREEYLESHLIEDQQSLSLKELAERHEIGFGTMRNKAYKERWAEQLDARRRAMSERMQEFHTKAIERVQGEAINEEVTVRLRHARTARAVQNKGLHRLANVNPEDLTIREAIELVKLGMAEERIALGVGQRNISPLVQEQAAADLSVDLQSVDVTQADAMLMELLETYGDEQGSRH